MTAGFARSYAPRVDDDMPLIVTCVGLLLIALVPHTAHEYGGPLCASSSLFHATERVLRAFLFATVYCVIACTVEIMMPRPNGLFVASIRACGASVWILACSVWILPIAVAQIVLVVWSRVRQPNGFESMPMNTPPESDIEGDAESNGYLGDGLDDGLGGGLGGGLGNGGTKDVDVGAFRIAIAGQSVVSHARPTVDQMRQLADSI